MGRRGSGAVGVRGPGSGWGVGVWGQDLGAETESRHVDLALEGFWPHRSQFAPPPLPPCPTPSQPFKPHHRIRLFSSAFQSYQPCHQFSFPRRSLLRSSSSSAAAIAGAGSSAGPSVGAEMCELPADGGDGILPLLEASHHSSASVDKRRIGRIIAGEHHLCTDPELEYLGGRARLEEDVALKLLLRPCRRPGQRPARRTCTTSVNLVSRAEVLACSHVSIGVCLRSHAVTRVMCVRGAAASPACVCAMQK